jgi:hypothetical protein
MTSRSNQLATGCRAAMDGSRAAFSIGAQSLTNAAGAADAHT